MKIVWSSTKITFPGYFHVDSAESMERLLERPSNVDVLVFHTSRAGIERLTKIFLSKKIKKIYYINENPSDEISNLVIGVHGVVLTDEFYLEDLAMLDELDTTEVGSELELLSEYGDVTVIQDFLNKIGSGDTTFTSKYRDLVKRSAEQLVHETVEANKRHRRTAEASIKILNPIIDRLDKLAAARDREKDELNKELDKLAAQTIEPRQGIGSGVISMYPETVYTSMVPGIIVKEIGSVPFLTSFMMGVLDYAINTLHKRARLTIILPPGENYQSMYQEDTRHGHVFITDQNHNQASVTAKSVRVAYINAPKIKTMKQLITSDMNLHLILDRRQTSAKPYYKSSAKSPLTTYYAVQSNSILNSFSTENPSITAKKSFSSLHPLKDGMFTIPLFDNYSANSQARLRAYADHCTEYYKKLLGE